MAAGGRTAPQHAELGDEALAVVFARHGQCDHALVQARVFGIAVAGCLIARERQLQRRLQPLAPEMRQARTALDQIEAASRS